MQKELIRRDFLAAGTASFTSLSLVGCDLLSRDPAQDGPDAGNLDDNGSREAPVLARQVEAGDLPPLEERIPEEPMVLSPLDQAGRYGGTIRRGEITMQSNRNIPIVARAGLTEWGLQEVEPVPALASTWEITDDGTTYTFTLRNGTRWSDGEPFTADDLIFYYEAVMLNEELTPAPPTWLQTSGEPVEISKVDDITVEFRFGEPHGLLLRYLAFPGHAMAIITPAHYLRQFHPDYADADDLDELVEESGLETWVDLFMAMNDAWLNPDLPVLGAWRTVQAPGAGADTRAIMERNPYYWKTDDEGRQLPYVDRLIFTAVNEETVVLAASNGEIDLSYNYIGTHHTPVLARHAEQGNYRIHNWTPSGGWVAIHVNQCHSDPVIRELMQNTDFRAALSHSIDREEMNQVLFGGAGRTGQPVPITEDAYYVEGTGQRFTEYDPELANRLLDDLGLNNRDGDGFRTRPDGERLRLEIVTFPFETGADSVEAYGLVKEYWEEVGIRTSVENLERTLWSTRVTANEYDIAGTGMVGYMWDIDPLWYVPTSELTYWATDFGRWYASGGSEGEEPPAELRRLQDLYDQMKATVDDDERLAVGREIIAAHDENVWVIGTVTRPFQPVVVNDDLVNVKEEAVADYRSGHEGITGFEQVAYVNPGDHQY